MSTTEYERCQIKMVSISVQGATVVLKVLGFHKILSLKSTLQFNKSNIQNIKIAEMSTHPPLIKCPGTSIPGIIAAGTFRGNGKQEFWDRTYKKAAIEIELKNEKYSRIVVNVENPEEIIKSLQL